jgi:hypothetical protein
MAAPLEEVLGEAFHTGDEIKVVYEITTIR